MILILQHIEMERPGFIKDFFLRHKIDFEILKTYEQSLDPNDVERWSGLVIMGGPMGVYDTSTIPWLSAEKDFIKNFLAHQKLKRPVLGVCLGAQLLADALENETVHQGSSLEFGWNPVRWTEGALSHPLFKHLPECLEVFHWHGDTFDLPQGAVRLAASDLYLNQAFAYGPRIIGLQFHMEVTEELLEEWFSSLLIEAEIKKLPVPIDLNQQRELAKKNIPLIQENLGVVLKNLFST